MDELERNKNAEVLSCDHPITSNPKPNQSLSGCLERQTVAPACTRAGEQTVTIKTLALRLYKQLFSMCEGKRGDSHLLAADHGRQTFTLSKVSNVTQASSSPSNTSRPAAQWNSMLPRAELQLENSLSRTRKRLLDRTIQDKQSPAKLIKVRLQ